MFTSKVNDCNETNKRWVYVLYCNRFHNFKDGQIRVSIIKDESNLKVTPFVPWPKDN